MRWRVVAWEAVLISFLEADRFLPNRRLRARSNPAGDENFCSCDRRKLGRSIFLSIGACG